VYQIKGKGGPSLGHLYGLLKGSDAALYRAAHSLGFEPVLYLYYEEDGGDAGLIDSVLDFESYELLDPVRYLRFHGGITVQLEGENVTPVNWVTPTADFNCKFNCLSSTYLRRRNGEDEASLGMARGDLCLTVHRQDGRKDVVSDSRTIEERVETCTGEVARPVPVLLRLAFE